MIIDTLSTKLEIIILTFKNSYRLPFNLTASDIVIIAGWFKVSSTIWFVDFSDIDRSAAWLFDWSAGVSESILLILAISPKYQELLEA